MTDASAPIADTKTDEWPSYAEVLARKTTETLQAWADRYDRGVINLSAMIAVTSALYDATSGIVPVELSDTLADLHKGLTAEIQKPR